MKKVTRKQKIYTVALFLLFVLIGVFLLSDKILKYIGETLIYDDMPVESDTAVILNTGVEYYPRLIEAASIYKKGLAKKIIINGTQSIKTLTPNFAH